MSNKACRSDWRPFAGVLLHGEHARVLIEQVEQYTKGRQEIPLQMDV